MFPFHDVIMDLVSPEARVKYILKCQMQTGGHFVSVLMCLEVIWTNR